MPTDQNADVRKFIKSEALSIGFSGCGISRARALSSPEQKFTEWVESGFHEDMHYLEKQPSRRFDPRQLMEGTRSVITLIYKYKPEESQLLLPPFKIARFALGKDYHVFLKSKMELLAQAITRKTGQFTYRLFTDSAPIAEKSWAVTSGLGWIGKNSLLINPDHGSYTFICEILTSLDLEGDEPEITDHCGNCSLCIDQCPSQAILEGRKIDARRCLSYHTIETRDEVPAHLRPMQDHWIYGCDVCQQVCPYNKRIEPQTDNWIEANPLLSEMQPMDWKKLSEESFNTIFNGSGISRLGYQGLMNKIRSAEPDLEVPRK